MARTSHIGPANYRQNREPRASVLITSAILQAEEVERQKQLILEGKIPVEKASKELMQHPVLKISQLTKKIIGEKGAKVSAVSVL